MQAMKGGKGEAMREPQQSPFFSSPLDTLLALMAREAKGLRQEKPLAKAEKEARSLFKKASGLGEKDIMKFCEGMLGIIWEKSTYEAGTEFTAQGLKQGRLDCDTSALIAAYMIKESFPQSDVSFAFFDSHIMLYVRHGGRGFFLETAFDPDSHVGSPFLDRLQAEQKRGPLHFMESVPFDANDFGNRVVQAVEAKRLQRLSKKGKLNADEAVAQFEEKILSQANAPPDILWFYCTCKKNAGCKKEELVPLYLGVAEKFLENGGFGSASRLLKKVGFRHGQYEAEGHFLLGKAGEQEASFIERTPGGRNRDSHTLIKKALEGSLGSYKDAKIALLKIEPDAKRNGDLLYSRIDQAIGRVEAKLAHD